MKRSVFLVALVLSVASLAAQTADRPLTVGVVGHTGQGNYGHGEDTVWLKIPQLGTVRIGDGDDARLRQL